MRFYTDEEDDCLRYIKDNNREVEYLNYQIDELEKRLRIEIRRRSDGHYIAQDEVRHLEYKLHEFYSQRDNIERQLRRMSRDMEEDEDGNYSHNYNYHQEPVKAESKPSVKLEKVKMKARKFLK